MPIMISPEKIRWFPFFAAIPQPELKEIAMFTTQVTHKPGHCLFQSGDTAKTLYLIIDGEVELRMPLGARTMQQACITKLVRGQVFGWSALVEPFAYHLGAYVTEACLLGAVRGPSLCKWMGQNPEYGYVLMNRIAEIIEERLNEICLRFVSLVEGERWQRLSVRRSTYITEGGTANQDERA